MAISDVGICNSALYKLGADRITALTDDTKEGRLCNEQYSKLRDEVLRAHPWNFAIKRVELAQISETPVFEWAYVYQLPNDCLRVLQAETKDVIYAVEGRKVYSDESTMYIKYIGQITDTATFDPQFAEALACRLAADIAYAITQSATVAQTMWEAYNSALRVARSCDAQEGTPEELQNTDWLVARY